MNLFQNKKLFKMGHRPGEFKALPRRELKGTPAEDPNPPAGALIFGPNSQLQCPRPHHTVDHHADWVRGALCPGHSAPHRSRSLYRPWSLGAAGGCRCGCPSSGRGLYHVWRSSLGTSFGVLQASVTVWFSRIRPAGLTWTTTTGGQHKAH